MEDCEHLDDFGREIHFEGQCLYFDKEMVCNYPQYRERDGKYYMPES